MPNRLKELRNSKGLSMKQMSKELVEKKYFDSITDATLSNYENEKREPKLETWVKLADYFGVDVGYLQGLSDFENRSSAKDNFLKNVKEDSDAFIERKYSVLDPFIAMDAKKHDQTIRLLQEHLGLGDDYYDNVNIIQKRRMAWIIESIMDTPTQINNTSVTDDVDRFIDVMITAVNDWYEPTQPAKSDNVTNYKSRYPVKSNAQNKKASDDKPETEG